MRYMRRVAVTLTALVLTLTVFWGADRSGERKFQQGIDLMETRGDLAAAVKLFEEVSKSTDRGLAARSLLYLGQCYEKMGHDGARKAYERIVRQFADQPDLVAEARSRLAALDRAARATKPPSMAARQVWEGPGVDTEGTVSPNGKFLSFVDWETGDLAERDLATGQNRRLTNKGSWNDSDEFAQFSAISRDGKHVAYAWYNKEKNFELRIVPLNGGPSVAKPRVLIQNPEVTYLEPRDWSPDGKQVAVILERNDRTAQIALVSAADGSTRVLKSLEWRWPSRVGFSPDGRFIVYDLQVRPDSVERDIFVLSADGNREAPLVAGPANDSAPVWTPDGNKVLFFSDRTGTQGLWTIDVRDGKPQGSPELLKANIGAAFPLGMTRDGAFYYGLRTGMEDIYTAEIDPETGRIVTPPVRASERFVGSNIGPVWSPDGQYLAYHSRRGSVRYGPGALVIVIRSLKTGEEREFPSRLDQRDPVRWFPDSKALLVLARDSDRRHFSLYRLELDTGSFSLIRRTDSAGRARVSPDGRSIYYAKNGPDRGLQRIVLYDIATGREREVYAVTGQRYFPSLALSKDGSQLAFLLNDSAEKSQSLLVMPSSGGPPHEALKSRRDVDGPIGIGFEWTPDGRYLLFTKSISNSAAASQELWRVASSGSKAEKVGLAMELLRSPSVHPDGRRIAFDTGQQAKFEVWVLENFLPAMTASR